MTEQIKSQPEELEPRKYHIDIRSCIDPLCNGELYELEYMENFNWITAEFKCTKCAKEFTVKIEV